MVADRFARESGILGREVVPEREGTDEGNVGGKIAPELAVDKELMVAIGEGAGHEPEAKKPADKNDDDEQFVRLEFSDEICFLHG